ncbi:MAG TPA: hypothetical protein QGH10_17580, partial [Armatimonadota bacterium]|nr:hypothetical protein [Armatimonadota bacterium]
MISATRLARDSFVGAWPAKPKAAFLGILMHRSIACLALILLAPLASGADFTGSWSAVPDRTWAGPDYWANRLQDWRVADGRLECIEARAGKPMRAVHLLTHSLSSSSGSLRMSVRTGVIEGAGNTSPEAATGFLVGAGGREMDYRSAALIHHNPGPGAGLFCGVDSRGRAFIRDFERKPQPGEPGPAPGRTLSDAELRFSAQPSGKTYTLTIAAHDPESGAVLSQASLDGVDPERLIGNVALVSHPATGKSTGRFWFNDWAVSGSKVRAHPDHVCGPVLCTQYTVHEGVLKLTAQMMPLGIDDAQAVELQVRDGDAWETVARTDIIRSGFTAPFRVEGWDPGRDARYRVVHDLGTYEGTIRRDPIGKDSIVVAAFTGNHNCARGIDGKGPYSWRNGIWFPHADIVGNVGIHDPDLLFFSGDQIYEGASPTGTERKPIERAELDYLYKWYLWCWAFRDLTRDRPTVTMPDDHDVYQGNIWGMGGARGDANKGGYSMPPEWLRTVERTQTSHLPDPFDPTPIQQGLGVYYTDLTVGGVGFAILEDRKFKSSPTLITAEKTPDNHITEEEFDGRD